MIDEQNFYKTEAAYENSIEETKELVEKIINIDINKLDEKLKAIGNDKYIEFKDLFKAVIGRNTNKYYYCENEEDVKYYKLELGKVYRKDNLYKDILIKNNEEKPLNLKARAYLANDLYLMINDIKNDFINIHAKEDLSGVTEIKNYLDWLILLDKYLKMLKDENKRLKILVAEQSIFEIEKSKLEYNKKGIIGKWILKNFGKDKDIY